MSAIHAPWQAFREGLAELVGIRSGLALTDDRVDHYLGLEVGAATPAEIARVSPSRYKLALYSALLDCGSHWCDFGQMPRVTAWIQMSQDTELYVAAHDLIHCEVHAQGTASKNGTHRDCGLDAGDESLPMSIRGPASVAKSDLFVLNARLDDLDFARVGGTALSIGGESLVRATKLLLEALRAEQHTDPWLRCETSHATSIAALSDLFDRADCSSRSARFFDQRFIDFLVANLEELPRIHWRQFERLVAEYLHRQGYEVELGPGSNDDGVDIRIWPSEAEVDGPPLLIVQCKRQRAKIEKVVVKALWADVQAEGATRGMVATTNSISPGAASTIAARGYSIDSADQAAIVHWLQTMRTPGQGPSLV